jgi:hypothetical protein
MSDQTSDDDQDRDALLLRLLKMPPQSRAETAERVRDIWRAAQLMLKRYGDQALKESAARATELTLVGDDDGAATWHRIMEAVTQLPNTTPPGPLH